MRLKDKVAIISGAASGMGASTAKLFAQEGAKVVVADLLEAEGRQVVEAIASSGGQARFQKLDVASEADWAAAVAATLQAHGRIDVLINNAGVSGSDPDRLSLATWDRQMSINAKGVFLGMRAVIPAMQKAKRGSIVNISSISGVVGQSFVHMGYNASKGAVRTMTKAAAVQFAADGIRVNSVHPGLMPPMRTSKLSADPKIRAGFLTAIPMGREGRVEEVAYANLFLASDEASYITGAELPVDGGYLAG
jgi:NAD(P)-dependent dehydrogenase (short-subunit alcohol dehydrogenase family)